MPELKNAPASVNVYRIKPSQQRVLRALEKREFFKLIIGGSFTDAKKAHGLAKVYASAGAHCIDIAPDETVLDAVDQALQELPPEIPLPMMMISLPLDADPHFRKIDLSQEQCILCDACIPACPTDAIATDLTQLLITQPLCYGCGRCVDICPTEALSLTPFHQDQEKLEKLLSDPRVDAVELHTRYADPYMLAGFFSRLGSVLKDKLVFVCFRPSESPVDRWQAFLARLQSFVCETTPFLPLVLQIDGKPMSGSEDLQASVPSLIAAQEVYQTTNNVYPLITISGGINAFTAEHLKNPEYQFISGVGMGTMARKAVWPYIESGDTCDQAFGAARQIVQAFQNRFVCQGL